MQSIYCEIVFSFNPWLFSICVQTDVPPDVDAAAAKLTNWQPLVAINSSDQGICPHALARQYEMMGIYEDYVVIASPESL